MKKDICLLILLAISCSKSSQLEQVTIDSKKNETQKISSEDSAYQNKMETLQIEYNSIVVTAEKYYANRQFDEAIKTYELGLSDRFNDLEFPEVDLKVLVKRKIEEIKCAKDVELLNQKPRTGEETVRELLIAIKNKNKAEILKLIGCAVDAVEANSFWYPEPNERHAVAEMLMKRVKSGSISFKKVSQDSLLENFSYIITNDNNEDKDDVYLRLGTFPTSPETEKITGVSWDYYKLKKE